jgi:hypothetical protein
MPLISKQGLNIELIISQRVGEFIVETVRLSVIPKEVLELYFSNKQRQALCGLRHFCGHCQAEGESLFHCLIPESKLCLRVKNLILFLVHQEYRIGRFDGDRSACGTFGGLASRVLLL